MSKASKQTTKASNQLLILLVILVLTLDNVNHGRKSCSLSDDVLPDLIDLRRFSKTRQKNEQGTSGPRDFTTGVFDLLVSFGCNRKA